TGVQTCALPILISNSCSRPRARLGSATVGFMLTMATLPCLMHTQINKQRQQRSGQRKPLRGIAPMLRRAHAGNRPVGAIGRWSRLEAQLISHTLTPERLPKLLHIHMIDQPRPAFG